MDTITAEPTLEQLLRDAVARLAAARNVLAYKATEARKAAAAVDAAKQRAREVLDVFAEAQAAAERAKAQLDELVAEGRRQAAELQRVEDQVAQLEREVKRLEATLAAKPPVPPPVVTTPYDYALSGAVAVEAARTDETVEAALLRLRDRAPSPPAGSVLVLTLPPGVRPGLNIASGFAREYVPGWWGGAVLRIVGPDVGSLEERPVAVFDPNRDNAGGDTISLFNRDGGGLDRGALELWGIEVRNAGRSGIHANTGRPVRVDLHRVHLRDSAAQAGERKWLCQLYQTSMSMFGVRVHAPASTEHVCYPHALGLGDMIWDDVVVTAIGGQCLQVTERESEVPNRAPGLVTLRNCRFSGFAKHAGRAGSAVTFAGGGVRALLDGVVIEDLDPTDTLGQDASVRGTSYGALTTWSPEADDQSYADEDLAQQGFGNVALTLRRSVFRVANGNRPVANLTDCAMLDVEDCVFDSTNGREVLVGEGHRGVGAVLWRRNRGTARLVLAGRGERALTESFQLSQIGAQPAVAVR